MARLFDHQMTNLADFDCFSQVVFQNVDDYKRMKQDPWYKEHLVGDHEKFRRYETEHDDDWVGYRDN